MGTGGTPDRLICRCFVVAESTIRTAIRGHDLRHVEEVTAVTHAGGGCSSCWDEIQEVLESVHGPAAGRNVPDAAGMTDAQKRVRILELIEREVRPIFDRNGLDLRLADVAGDRVLLRLSGEAVGTTAPSFLALKRWLVEKMSAACGGKMNLVELNVLEGLSRTSKS